jgi:hypothetical protein
VIKVVLRSTTSVEENDMSKNLRTFTLGLLLAGALAPPTGGTSIAKATSPYAAIRLDNYPNGGSISNTGTKNTITVWYFSCLYNNWVQAGARSITSVSGTNDFTINTGDLYDLSKIEIATNGGDWFWLDQLELIDGSTSIWSWGIDNTVGACISTEPTDGNDSICWPTGSHSALIFNVRSC